VSIDGRIGAMRLVNAPNAILKLAVIFRQFLSDDIGSSWNVREAKKIGAGANASVHSK
jgi:hypothetical protein